MNPSPRPTRRALLGGLVVGASALAGCTDTSGGEESTPKGTEGMLARLRLREVPSLDCESPDPIVFADLPSEEQDLMETAIERDEYAVPTEETPPAFDSFRERVEARTDTCGELVVYLEREGTYYRVALVNGDHIIASTRETPDG
jgi:hypothetical protein